MNRLTRILIASFLLLAFSDINVRAEGFEVVGWQLHDADIQHIEMMLDAAQEYGVNHVQLSHGIIMYADDIEQPERAELISKATSLALEKGIDSFIWSHEFNTDNITACITPSSKNAGAVEFWNARKNAYRSSFETVPDLAGTIVSFGSSNPDPWALMCTCSWCVKHDMADRIALIIAQTGGVTVREFGKKYFVRTFIHSPDELDWMGEGLKRVPPRDGLWVMSKAVPQDWQPYYPHNKLIGNVGGHPQVVEIDLASEYTGRSAFPYDMTDYLKYRILHARDNGVKGFVARVERGSDTILGTSSEINLHAFHTYLKNPDSSPDDVRLKWIEKKYGLDPESEDAKILAGVLKDSFDAIRKMYYVLGFWALEKGSDLTQSATFPKMLTQKSTALYDPKFSPVESKLLNIDEETFDRIMLEKSEAVDIASSMLDRFESIESLSPEDYRELHSELSLLKSSTEIWRIANGALWSYRLFSETGEEKHREQAADFIEALSRYYEDSEIPADEAAGRWPASSGKVKDFVDNFKMVFPDAPSTKDDMEYKIPLPLITGIHSSTYADAFNVVFKTSEPTSCSVEYGTHMLETNNSSETEASASIDHAIEVISLKPATQYFYYVLCSSENGEIKKSTDFRALTESK